MNFETLYSLLLETQYQPGEVIPQEDYKNYNSISFFNDKQEADLCYNFLRASGYDKKGAFVAYKPPEGKRPFSVTQKNISEDEFYFLFVPKTFDAEERKKLKFQFRDYLKQRNFPGWQMYNTLAFQSSRQNGRGGVLKYNPASKYNLDNETKETWRDVITTL